MKQATYSGTIETLPAAFGGGALKSAVTFNYNVDEFESMTEVRTAKAELSDDEEVKVVNTDKKANARSKATIAALEAAGYKKLDTNSVEFLRISMIKTLAKMNEISEEDATIIIDGLKK